MKATEITRTTIVRFELDPNTDAQDVTTKGRAEREAQRIFQYHDQPYEGLWIETRFMPMGFVEVEYRTVIGLGEGE